MYDCVDSMQHVFYEDGQFVDKEYGHDPFNEYEDLGIREALQYAARMLCEAKDAGYITDMALFVKTNGTGGHE
jgi:hypothetical protein